jgi:hypothetical protein
MTKGNSIYKHRPAFPWRIIGAFNKVRIEQIDHRQRDQLDENCDILIEMAKHEAHEKGNKTAFKTGFQC